MDTSKDLPIMIEAIIYKIVNDEKFFLVLKRTNNEGGWWQPVIGHMQSNETIEDALKREIKEETGITTFLRIIDNVWHFHWEHESEMHLEFVYAVEVNESTKVKLNPEEHNEYRWLKLVEAIKTFKYENNKKAIQYADEKICQINN